MKRIFVILSLFFVTVVLAQYPTPPTPPGIAGLNASKPLDTDPVSQGAAAIRQIKYVLLTSFPGSIFTNGLFNTFTVNNVIAFGAFGNGVSNDTAAIQAAINATCTSGGGLVFFPTGSYLVCTQLLISCDKVYLAGTGEGPAAIVVTNEIGDVVKWNLVTFGGIRDMQIAFSGNGSTGGAALSVRHSQFFKAERLRIYDFYLGVKITSCITTSLRDVETDLAGDWTSPKIGSAGFILAEELGLGGWDNNSGISIDNCTFKGMNPNTGFLSAGGIINNSDGVTILNTGFAWAGVGLFINPITINSPEDLIRIDAACGFDTCSNKGVAFFSGTTYVGACGGNTIGGGTYFYNNPTHLNFNMPTLTTGPALTLNQLTFSRSTGNGVELQNGKGFILNALTFTDVRNSNTCILVNGNVTNTLISGVSYTTNAAGVCGAVVEVLSNADYGVISSIASQGASLTNVATNALVTHFKIDWATIQ